ncbi:MAG TPA: ATP-binding protein [Streptosporangiaceae bacterium]|nr:ATP-binding protein [Streptosporangiaceae bacterium]
MGRRSFAEAARRWLANRTLGGRLIAGLVMLLAVACAVVGGATYLGLRGFLVGQLDQQLQAAAHRYAVACQQHRPANPPPPDASGDDHPDGPDCGTINGQAAGTLGARIERGVVTSASLVRGRCDLSAAEQSALVRVPVDGRLSVTDNGPGIPDGLQPDLFDRFVHGRNPRSPESGGTGLGLAIVDAVVEAHGGSVAVSSRPGLTEFAIVLPPLTGAERGGRNGRATPPA